MTTVAITPPKAGYGVSLPPPGDLADRRYLQQADRLPVGRGSATIPASSGPFFGSSPPMRSWQWLHGFDRLAAAIWISSVVSAILDQLGLPHRAPPDSVHYKTKLPPDAASIQQYRRPFGQ